LRLEIESDAAARGTWSCATKITVKPATRYRLRLRAMVAQVAGKARCYAIAYEDGLVLFTWSRRPIALRDSSGDGTSSWPAGLVRST
jgi:hypothetical protein